MTGGARNRYEGAVHVAAPLESLVAQQAATIDRLSAERAQYRKLYLDLLERCAMLERGIIVGKKAEPFKGQDPQLTLQMLEMLLDPEAGQQEPEPPRSRTRSVSTTAASTGGPHSLDRLEAALGRLAGGAMRALPGDLRDPPSTSISTVSLPYADSGANDPKPQARLVRTGACRHRRPEDQQSAARTPVPHDQLLSTHIES